MTRSGISSSVAALLAALALAAPRDAAACGGTFCDSGPNAMPVDQSGENILFVMDGQNVEAHVQIQYQGSAARFAWIVPMPVVPDVSVGSAALFTNLLSGTVPNYGFSMQYDQCGGSSGAGGFGFGGSGGSGGGATADAGSGGPQVVYDKTVGAFQVVVLQGGTAQEVSDWLATNNYQSINTAPAILQKYLSKNYVFVAIKLTAGAGTDEIHPLVFRYPGTAPCVPLELTAVAATEDMGVRAFFLGDDRVVPTNYKSIELNPARIDWTTRGANYNQVVSRGADSAVANGHAFVTEYAGPSSVVNTASVYSPAWNAAAFVGLDPTLVIDELTKQGLAYCYTGGCQFMHPLIVPLLHTYLPVPAGMADGDFYSCLSCNASQIDQTAWDAAAFSSDFQQRVVDPGVHARDVVQKYPYLTRMFTTISPAEMTEDPDFHADPSLSAKTVTNTFNVASERVTCSGTAGMILPDARQVGLPASGLWPAFTSQMPWVETITEYPLNGAPVQLVDNTALIDDQLAAWNKSVGWPPSVGSTVGGTGGTGGAAGGAGTGAGGNGATPDASAGGAGCACSLPGGARQRGALGAVAAAALALALGRRRRR